MRALLLHASEVYAVVYFGLIIAVSLIEWALPHRPVADTLRLRWLSNIGISILDTVLIRSLFPMLSVGWAAYCAGRGWGFLNQVAWPPWLGFAVTFVALDFLYYAQHYALHRVPVLWRLHRTHHTDQEFDLTTGVRFHPLETLVTTTVVFAAILAVGAPPAAVFALQLLSIGVSFVDHGNIRVPASWDRLLRLIVVTPDMHRIHHSMEAREGQSNFSNLFSCWDWLFATYLDEPAAGRASVRFGVGGFEERRHLALPWMLAQPFLKDPSAGTATSPAGEPATPIEPAIGAR